MSVGSFFGAVAGGIIGFVVTGGNPWGALYGASIGFGLGMAIDPMTPDMPSVGAPDQMTQVMSSTVGDPVPDLAGTGKIAGHLLCYGKERAEPVYSTSSGGGGKGGGSPEPQPQITGYKYYMSWVLGIVAGPVDTLYAIYKGEDVVWEGELNCPASGGKETIVLTGVGSVDFYFGTADQMANSKVGEIISDATLNTPYRNMCWAFFDDCYIGEYNRTPTMKFIVKKIPENAFSDKHEIQTYDCNPAHAMWYILHDLTGLPESWLHSDDFATVALSLWAECRGLSILFDRQQSALNYLESVNVHVENVLRYGTDGKFHPKLIRDDYVVGDLPLIDEDVMLEEPTFNRKSWIDTLNEMKIQYSELLADRPKLYGTGFNSVGQLGSGDTVASHIFNPADSVIMFGSVSCCNVTTLAVAAENSLWATGGNGHGQFGDGSVVGSLIFKKIANDCISCSSGINSSFKIKVDGTLWGSGVNDYGILGVNSVVEQHSFIQEISGFNWQQVTALSYHALAVRDDGLMFVTGLSNYGQSSSGNTVAGKAAKKVFTQILYDGGGGEPYPTDNSLWKKVATGAYCSFGIKENGTLWATGSNGNGQLGFGDTTRRHFFEQVGSSQWKSIASAFLSTVGIKEDGTLWGTGKNSNGELGLGDTNQRTLFTQISSDSWKEVYMDGYCMIAIKSDDTIWGSGRNSNYMLGLNHSNEIHVLTQEYTEKKWLGVSIGGSYSMGIK